MDSNNNNATLQLDLPIQFVSPTPTPILVYLPLWVCLHSLPASPCVCVWICVSFSQLSHSVLLQRRVLVSCKFLASFV